VKPDEVRATGRLATSTLADAVSHLEHVHRAIATRTFTLTSPASLPARVIHDAIATNVYRMIRGVGFVAGMAASELSSFAPYSRTPAGSTPRSNLALAVLNATLGHELAEQGSPLAIRMALRQSRANVAPRSDDLAFAFPEATSKVAVFIHGLGETEESWRLHADRHGTGSESTYGSRLAEDFGYTSLYLRYNTGLRIAENGRYLSELLDEVVAAWPVHVDELLLVGHSMGGLVVRSACHYGQENDRSWVNQVRHVFYLGSPHLGAGLERWVSHLASLADKLDESRPLASVLNRRSAGIKDLHAGTFLDDDWGDGAIASSDKRRDIPLLPWANHYAVSATVTKSRGNPLGRLVGDLLVQPASARGSKRISFTDEHKRHFGGLHHFDLLNHPPVYDAMREWIKVSVQAMTFSLPKETLVTPGSSGDS